MMNRKMLCAALSAVCAVLFASAEIRPFGDGERIAFLGDSITHGGRYVANLQVAWKILHPEAHPVFLSAGIGGDTAERGLARIETDLVPLRPDRVVVMFGMNDVAGYGVAEYRRRMVGLCDALDAKGWKVDLMTPTPYDEWNTNLTGKVEASRREPALCDCAAFVRELAAKRGYGFVDLYTPMRRILVAEPGTYHRGDRVHPGVEEHRTMTVEILRAAGADELPVGGVPPEMRDLAERLFAAQGRRRTLASYERMIRQGGADLNDRAASFAVLDKWMRDVGSKLDAGARSWHEGQHRQFKEELYGKGKELEAAETAVREEIFRSSARVRTVPVRGVPAGCDGAVMSDGYWKLWNADVQRQLDADIEANRKADAVFTLDAPVGTEVTVEQLDHDFRFGAHIFNFDQLGKDEYNDAYKASYGEGGIFNQATVAFYWNKYEPVPGRLRSGGDYEDTAYFWNSLGEDEAMEHPFWRRPAAGPVVDFLKSKGVAIHGHILIWGSAKPQWIYDWYCPEDEKRAFDRLGIPRHAVSLSDKNAQGWDGSYNALWRKAWTKAYEKVSEKDIAGMAPQFTANMRRLFRKRVFDVAAEYAGIADSWDVVNESSKDWTLYRQSRTGLPVWLSTYGLMPGDYPLHALLDCKEAFPASTKLAINDYNVCEDFLAQVKDLADEGAKIDIVGCQMHIFDTNDCMRLAKGATDVMWVGTPKTIRDRLDLMAKTGRRLHVSEITITSPGADAQSRQIQAILTRNIYRAWFAHKALMGITWWNTVDKGGVKGEPLVSGLFTRDMKKKPAYLALEELINGEWMTRERVKVEGEGEGEGRGVVRFRGFCGRYRLSWKDAAGKARSVEVRLPEGGVRAAAEVKFPDKFEFVRSFTVDGKAVSVPADAQTLDLTKVYPGELKKGECGTRWADVAMAVTSPRAQRVRLMFQNDWFGELYVNGARVGGDLTGPCGRWGVQFVDLREGPNVIRFRTRAGSVCDWYCGFGFDKGNQVKAD